MAFEPAGHWNIAALTGLTQMDEAQMRQTLAERRNKVRNLGEVLADEESLDTVPYVPYNLLTQHSIPDKSIADCVEALIGAYLVSCGPHAILLFMSWLGRGGWWERLIRSVKSALRNVL